MRGSGPEPREMTRTPTGVQGWEDRRREPFRWAPKRIPTAGSLSNAYHSHHSPGEQGPSSSLAPSSPLLLLPARDDSWRSPTWDHAGGGALPERTMVRCATVSGEGRLRVMSWEYGVVMLPSIASTAKQSSAGARLLIISSASQFTDHRVCPLFGTRDVQSDASGE